MMETTKRQQYVNRHTALKNERASWLDHWRELAEHILPRRSRFVTADRNKGSKRNDKIINGTPRRAARILAAGMMAGLTSPARPWFNLTTPDPELAEAGPVRSWLHVVEQRMRTMFAGSNIYNCFHTVYEDIGVPGTAAFLVEEDAEDVLRGYVFPAGSYCLANSARLQVDSLYREVSMTVGQLVEQFGLEACSQAVREQYNRGHRDAWVDVLHVIQPRRGYAAGKWGPRGMAWSSCWMEAAAGEHELFLRESGFEERPFMAPRWAVTGEDVYGQSPAMDALGDCKALQLYERRKAQAVSKLVDPPMVGPSSLMGKKASLLPGDVTHVDVMHGGQKFEPAHQTPPAAIQVLEASAGEIAQRVNEEFYVDLFLMLAQSDRRQITAREVAERHEEKMLQLGPVLERLQDELFDPFIDRAFAIGLRRGLFPPPPEELQGQDIRVEYISILAQAMKLLGTSAVERLAGFVGNLAAVKPEVLDKVDFDEMVDTYADMLGVPPSLVKPDDVVAQIRAERAEQERALRQGEAALAAAQGAKTLSETDMKGDTALNRLVNNLGGVAAGVAGGGDA